MKPPNQLGAPQRYTEWRFGQDAALQHILDDPRRFQVLQLPTGLGKSLVGMVYAIIKAANGSKSTYLTATKNLQDQLLRDYTEVGLKDVRGMSNYQCVAEGGTCDEGSCTDGEACWAKPAGCAYFDAIKAAQKVPLRSTNYAWHFTQAVTFQDALGDSEILICDEAHAIPEQVSNFLRVVMRSDELVIPPDAETWDATTWASWAQGNLMGVSQQMRKGMPKWKRKKLKDLKERLLKIIEIPKGDIRWIIDPVWNGWSFEPLWPGPFLEKLLWRGTKKVILMSATVTKEQLARMGVKDYHWIEQPSPIPTSQRPIYFFPVADMMSKRATETDLWRWMRAIDQIIGERLDRKGIVHAVSYDRMKFILANSEWRELMVVHESKGAKEAVERFKASDPPCILVSPSVTTGEDFPFDAARYQIIGKVPFAPPSALLKARTKEDKGYPYYTALKGIEQMAGRVARDPKDVGETIILDSNFLWLYRRHGGHTTRSFQNALRNVDSPPQPLVIPGSLDHKE